MDRKDAGRPAQGQDHALGFPALQAAAKQYNWNYGAELYGTDGRARILRLPELEKDGRKA